MLRPARSAGSGERSGLVHLPINTVAFEGPASPLADFHGSAEVGIGIQSVAHVPGGYVSDRLNPNSDLGGAVEVRREERCVPGGYVSDRLNPNSDLGGAVEVRREERCVPGGYVSDRLNPNSDLGGAVEVRERGCRGARMPPDLRGGALRRDRGPAGRRDLDRWSAAGTKSAA